MENTLNHFLYKITKGKIIYRHFRYGPRSSFPKWRKGAITYRVVTDRYSVDYSRLFGNFHKRLYLEIY